MAFEKKVRVKDCERVTVRIPVEDYEVVKQYAAIVPGATPAGVIRDMVLEAVPKLQQMVTAVEAMQAGDSAAGVTSISTLMASIAAQALAAQADVDAFQATRGKGKASE